MASAVNCALFIAPEINHAMHGLHLTADLYHCQCDAALLVDNATLAARCRSHTEEAGLSIVSEQWHTFPSWQGQPGGVTGVLLLAESHLALHTWPETGSVTLDVYVCNLSGDNSGKATWLMDQLEQIFQPGRSRRQSLQRGLEE